MENNQHNALISSVADLDQNASLALVEQRLANGDNPLAIVNDCQHGLRIVGERYEQHQYYLAGLIMAGEIFRQIMALLQPSIEQHVKGNETGNILLGTVRGDIHDIGKNNLSMLLRCYGFVVYDIGVNVPPEEFVSQSLNLSPDIVGLSGLLSLSRDSMKETVRQLRQSANPTIANIPIIIGGGFLNQEVCDYVGADFWAISAMDGVRICQQILGSQPDS